MVSRGEGAERLPDDTPGMATVAAATRKAADTLSLPELRVTAKAPRLRRSALRRSWLSDVFPSYELRIDQKICWRDRSRLV
jgi:hypothetical protein